jgi:hypothetical protein
VEEHVEQVFFNVEEAKDTIEIFKVHTFSSKQGFGAQAVI